MKVPGLCESTSAVHKNNHASQYETTVPIASFELCFAITQSHEAKVNLTSESQYGIYRADANRTRLPDHVMTSGKLETIL